MAQIYPIPFALALLEKNPAQKESEYRLHKIHLSLDRSGAVAKIYDGEKMIFELHAPTKAAVLRDAKRWVDEQDEVQAAFDLHSM